MDRPSKVLLLSLHRQETSVSYEQCVFLTSCQSCIVFIYNIFICVCAIYIKAQKGSAVLADPLFRGSVASELSCAEMLHERDNMFFF